METRADQPITKLNNPHDEVCAKLARQISTVIARLAGDSKDLLDDYRFWRSAIPKSKSLAVSDPENTDS